MTEVCPLPLPAAIPNKAPVLTWVVDTAKQDREAPTTNPAVTLLQRQLPATTSAAIFGV